MTFTEEEYKSLIKLLLKELQKLQEIQKEPTQNLQEEDKIIDVTNDEYVCNENEAQDLMEETVEELDDESTKSKDIQNELKSFEDEEHHGEDFTKEFNEVIGSDSHVKDTHSKKFECNFCTRKFHRLDNLKRHDRSHAGEKPYECKTCFTMGNT